MAEDPVAVIGVRLTEESAQVVEDRSIVVLLQGTEQRVGSARL